MPSLTECSTRTALPLRARSQRATSKSGFSGVEFLNSPFQVLPSNGANGLSGSARVSAFSPPLAMANPDAVASVAHNNVQSVRFMGGPCENVICMVRQMLHRLHCRCQQFLSTD